MRTSEYKVFSRKFHDKLGHSPIVAQMELTFRCPLDCNHCYTACYNNPEKAGEELSTIHAKRVLDKCRQAGTVWLCFTGGDPLIREDFSELYSYARTSGFITTVFSSLTRMSDEVFDIFRKQPPFNIETTLNAATPGTYKAITKTDLFHTQLKNIKRLLKSKVEVRIKTQVTRENVSEIEKIKSLVESMGREFRPSIMLFARLDHDTSPCGLRLNPKEAIRINKIYGYYDEETRQAVKKLKLKDMITEPTDKLFTCAIGGHGFYISPEGRMFLCSSLREPDYGLLDKKATVREGFERLNRQVRTMQFKTKSICRSCRYRLICDWCAARAVLEKGALEEPVKYFCTMTKEIIKQEEETRLKEVCK